MVFGGLNSFIEAQMISSGGAPDGANFSLSSVSSPGTSDSNPDVAYNRSHNEYLAVFEREYQNLPQVDTDLYGRLVSPSGIPIGAAPQIIYGDNVDQANPSVAAIPTTPGNGKYFIAWESLYAPGNINIYGRRFSRDLAADGLIRMLSNSLGNESHPAVAADEHTDRFLIAWSQPWGGASNSQIYAQYFPQDDEILGESFPLGGSLTGLYSDETAVSSGLPGDFLLAYRDTGMGKADSDIFGQILGIRRYIPLVIH